MSKFPLFASLTTMTHVLVYILFSCESAIPLNKLIIKLPPGQGEAFNPPKRIACSKAYSDNRFARDFSTLSNLHGGSNVSQEKFSKIHFFN